MCHSLHFSKGYDIKSISKSPLPTENYAIYQSFSLDDYRKESSSKLSGQDVQVSKMGDGNFRDPSAS
jgi:hypothetical protein